jgi:hypothetical protein
MIALILLAATAATPTPAPTAASTKTPTATRPTPTAGTGQTALVAAPARESQTGGTRTLSDVARERKLGIKGVVGGTLSVAGTAGTTYYSPELAARVQRENDKAGLAASDEMWRTIKQERWVEENIHSPYNAHLHINAQRDWDSAAENCRKTPGCTPFYRK